jgi:hypothetical protein
VRRPDTIPALEKKQKVYIIIVKTKKKSTSILIMIKEIKSKKDLNSVYRPEND